MFAVVILGIGFIMVAAIFPVAIQQSQVNTQESVGAAAVRGAVNYLEQVAAGSDGSLVGGVVTPLFPATGYGTTDPTATTARPTVSGSGLWTQLRGNMILPDDPRFAFTFLYRRRGNQPTGSQAVPLADWDSYAQVIVIAVQTRNASIFTQASVNNYSARSAELQPRRITLTQLLDDSGAGADLIGVATTAAQGAPIAPDDINYGAVAEGAFIVIADDNIATPNVNCRGVLNGQIFRVGVRRADLDSAAVGQAWELAPGFDYTPLTYRDPGANHKVDNGGDDGAIEATPASLSGVSAWVIGRGYADPATPPTTASGFTGPAMDVAAYSTWVRVR